MKRIIQCKKKNKNKNTFSVIIYVLYKFHLDYYIVYTLRVGKDDKINFTYLLSKWNSISQFLLNVNNGKNGSYNYCKIYYLWNNVILTEDL